MTKLQRYSAVTKTGVETVCLASDVAALEAENERLLKYIKAGGHLEECYADEFSRTVDHEGNAETYSCTCGLEAILNREHEKP